MNFFASAGLIAAPARRPLVVGLVNNAGDRSLAVVEAQFAGLLRAASTDLRSGGRDVVLRLFAAPGIARTARPFGATGAPYEPLDALFEAELLDAVVVTGMEPQARRAQDEPAWPSIRRIANWAEDHAIPVLWSCLAAHMAVLHRDGIERVRLAEKMSGLFACEVTPHGLTAGAGARLNSPHSRWHDLPEAALAAAGYAVLSRSAEAGVDIFVRKGAAPAIFFQGHPEYRPDTLLREYRRDIRRALHGDTTPYPRVPRNLCSPDLAASLDALRQDVLAGRPDPVRIAAAMAGIGGSLPASSDGAAGAARLLANWLSCAPPAARDWPGGALGRRHSAASVP